MKNRLYLSLCMGLCVLSQPVRAISPEEATAGTIITAVAIGVGSYALFKHIYADTEKRDKKDLERWFCTALVAGPATYLASVLWFGFTPEMRYVFAFDTAGKNRAKEYATKEYKDVEELIEDYTSDYLDQAWLVDLHKDLVRDLQCTNKALRGFEQAQLEGGAEKLSQVNPHAYQELGAQKTCLEHNLSLLRKYKPFQEQQAAWISRDRHHCWRHCY